MTQLRRTFSVIYAHTYSCKTLSKCTQTQLQSNIFFTGHTRVCRRNVLDLQRNRNDHSCFGSHVRNILSVIISTAVCLQYSLMFQWMYWWICSSAKAFAQFSKALRFGSTFSECYHSWRLHLCDIFHDCRWNVFTYNEEQANYCLCPKSFALYSSIFPR